MLILCVFCRFVRQRFSWWRWESEIHLAKDKRYSCICSEESVLLPKTDIQIIVMWTLFFSLDFFNHLTSVDGMGKGKTFLVDLFIDKLHVVKYFLKYFSVFSCLFTVCFLQKIQTPTSVSRCSWTLWTWISVFWMAKILLLMMHSSEQHWPVNLF